MKNAAPGDVPLRIFTVPVTAGSEKAAFRRGSHAVFEAEVVDSHGVCHLKHLKVPVTRFLHQRRCFFGRLIRRLGFVTRYTNCCSAGGLAGTKKRPRHFAVTFCNEVQFRANALKIRLTRRRIVGIVIVVVGV